ncbi:MAG: potassium channel protein [archaeon]|nr:potassium channel protein [archaeon]
MNKTESMLLELKDTSEFMVDLAYASLLYNDIEIAKEVIFLERKMNEFSSDIQEHIINLGREQPDEISKFSVILRLQMAAEEIADAAASIADVVLKGLSDHPVIQMSIRESEVTIGRVVINNRSIIAGKTLGEVNLGSRCGTYVLAIKRGDRFMYGPDKNALILANDVLIVRGPEESSELFSDIASGVKTEF